MADNAVHNENIMFSVRSLEFNMRTKSATGEPKSKKSRMTPDMKEAATQTDLTTIATIKRVSAGKH